MALVNMPRKFSKVYQKNIAGTMDNNKHRKKGVACVFDALPVQEGDVIEHPAAAKPAAPAPSQTAAQQIAPLNSRVYVAMRTGLNFEQVQRLPSGPVGF